MLRRHLRSLAAQCYQRRPLAVSQPLTLTDVPLAQSCASHALWVPRRACATSAAPQNSTPAEKGTTGLSSLFDRSTAARREIHELWTQFGGSSPAAQHDDPAKTGERSLHQRLTDLLERYHISPSTPKEEDITRSLGESFDRLLLLCVPLGEEGTSILEVLLTCAGRLGREVNIRTIQHLFARCASYAEAIAIFYSLRRCNVNMNMEAYYAMLYSLQRLEEESWALKFADELEQTKGVSDQAMDFILQGCANQLLPENKPWVGNVMYSNVGGSAPQPTMSGSREAYDKLGEQWTRRYKEGPAADFVPARDSS